MALSRYHRILFIVKAFLATGCIQSKSEEQAIILAGSGEGKYWDIIAVRNGLERYNPAIKKAARYRDAKNGLPEDCIFFGKDNKLLHYHNIDSTKIIDPHIFAHDVFYNPDEYSIKEDTMEMEGFKYKLIHLDKELLVVKRMYNDKSILVIYAPSKWQDKTECKSLDCK